MTQKVEVPNTQIPTAGKLSIDDILLSMGEKGKDYAAARAGHSAEQPVAEERRDYGDCARAGEQRDRSYSDC